MKITNRQAVEMINALAGMGDKIIPRKLSFAIGKNLERLQQEIYKPYDAERLKIQRQYAVPDENGNQKVDAYNRLVFTDRNAYEDELEALLDIENEFEMHMVDEDIIDQCEKEEKYSSLTSREQIALMKMIRE